MQVILSRSPHECMPAMALCLITVLSHRTLFKVISYNLWITLLNVKSSSLCGLVHSLACHAQIKVTSYTVHMHGAARKATPFM